jgi:hypothetical protein
VRKIWLGIAKSWRRFILDSLPRAGNGIRLQGQLADSCLVVSITAFGVASTQQGNGMLSNPKGRPNCFTKGIVSSLQERCSLLYEALASSHNIQSDQNQCLTIVPGAGNQESILKLESSRSSLAQSLGFSAKHVVELAYFGL